MLLQEPHQKLRRYEKHHRRYQPQNEQLQATTDKQTSCHISHDQTSNKTSEYREPADETIVNSSQDLISWVQSEK